MTFFSGASHWRLSGASSSPASPFLLFLAKRCDEGRCLPVLRGDREVGEGTEPCPGECARLPSSPWKANDRNVPKLLLRSSQVTNGSPSLFCLVTLPRLPFFHFTNYQVVHADNTGRLRTPFECVQREVRGGIRAHFV